mmetsp:Transcript_135094/g.431686  ORF Transcript_135094/g.431686 Transcript_135094/m.431686 type:complete len:202 (+) Transcript_135094:296-901(+)
MSKQHKKQSLKLRQRHPQGQTSRIDHLCTSGGFGSGAAPLKFPKMVRAAEVFSMRMPSKCFVRRCVCSSKIASSRVTSLPSFDQQSREEAACARTASRESPAPAGGQAHCELSTAVAPAPIASATATASAEDVHTSNEVADSSAPAAPSSKVDTTLSLRPSRSKSLLASLRLLPANSTKWSLCAKGGGSNEALPKMTTSRT